MKTWKVVLTTLITAAILTGTIFFLIGSFKPKPSGILVTASPAASIYVNGALVGKTPFQKNMEAGEISLKLVPLVSDQNLIPFETRLTLISGIQTVVTREFGSSEEASSGDIISFDKGEGNGAGLIVISTPDNAQVSIDGVVRGFAPYKTTAISPAAHQITVKAPGYGDRNMTINTRSGYKLTLFAKLAKIPETSTPSPTPAPESQTYVLILPTPTGYLRVRTKPGTAGEEIGQVKPGEKFPLLDEDLASGWYKIRFEEPVPGLPNGIEGWVSNQYARKIEAP